MDIKDETLCAYLDGELTSEQAKAVEDALRSDGNLAARMEELRRVDALLRVNAQQIDDLPLPASLDAIFAQSLAKAASASSSASPDAHSPDAHSNVVPMRRRWRKVMQDRRLALPLAASIALIVGYAGLFTTGRDDQTAPAATLLAEGSAIDSALQGVLDREKSGVLRRVTDQRADQREVEIRLSFEAKDNSFCREFTVRLADRAQDALACRRAASRWELRYVSASGKAAADPAGYQAASSTDSQTLTDRQTSTGGEAFGMAVEAMMAGDALTADQERDLIRRGWSR